ncbi:MAG: PSD1 and planctomycete cytochrome C domain-containing protein, partial [Phycisphaerae bacterium]|nr:PSD1 and planctomycete cytochrome C domain-containing protein [Phycisphaerae bacterium]
MAGELGRSVTRWTARWLPTVLIAFTLGARAGAEPPRYGRDIRPILSDRCFQCHGPDAGMRMADLRLDVREEATRVRADGSAAIVPGAATESELWRRITSSDPKVAMPPADSHKKIISDEERESIQRWIDAGAEYEPHWAFTPPARPPLPEVPSGQESFVKNAIDRFVLATLHEAAIAPSPEADRMTLARRVYLDLTGLPPTPDEVDRFLTDTRADAYEQLVDTLFTAEPYRTRVAERLAVPWMDQARYADTSGIHMDAGRQMWLWRDWVINAYRANMPFDQFVIEQIGGDLLPQASAEQKIASGFHRNHVTSDEGGAIAEEYLVEYVVDRTATTGSVFLGLTVGCARCHDHKYDPVSQEEFFKLFAYFDSIEEPGLYSQLPNAQRALEPFLAVPTAEQRAMLAALNEEAAHCTQLMDTRDPAEAAELESFLADITSRAAIAWAPLTLLTARSTDGATFETYPDGAVRASGPAPAQDEYQLTFTTPAEDLTLLALEVLPDETRDNRIGRTANGNAVVTGISVTATSLADPARSVTVHPAWAWSDHTQTDGDYDITNLVMAREGRTWALGGHQKPGGRVALLLLNEPIGFEGGSTITVTIAQRSMYAEHTLAKLRVRLASISRDGLAMLPSAPTRWYMTGEFASGDVYAMRYGPEDAQAIDFEQVFGESRRWRFADALVDGRTVEFQAGIGATYLARTVYAPTARSMRVALGSDDGFALFHRGQTVASQKVDRSVAPEQNAATVPLVAGANLIVMKIVNTGGPAGFYWRQDDDAALTGDVMFAALPLGMGGDDAGARLETSWRTRHSPQYREAKANLAVVQKRKSDLDAQVPLTMVMREREMQRETYVLNRGAYDQPDTKRRVSRGIPAALGELPADAEANRLGLAKWLVSTENPLTARVAVNRWWEMCFGLGIVKTTEDFGLQGDWPSHPELLDWLAVEFRESGWNVQHMLRLIVTSATYRQQSATRPELAERDAENRLLASFPRRRLTAEQIRDTAIYTAGLLVEKVGGPSVKPYQPDGLWQEVAMPQSNTRIYEQGTGDDLWRRSLYTYWKRAAPP